MATGKLGLGDEQYAEMQSLLDECLRDPNANIQTQVNRIAVSMLNSYHPNLNTP